MGFIIPIQAVRLNVNSLDVDGMTPMMLAAEKGHPEVCADLGLRLQGTSPLPVWMLVQRLGTASAHQVTIDLEC